jgi:hypothetical protein
VLPLRLRPWICTWEDLLLWPLSAWLPSQVVEVLFVRVLAESGLEEEEEDLLLFLLLLLLLLLWAFLLSFLLPLPLETECRA